MLEEKNKSGISIFQHYKEGHGRFLKITNRYA